MFGLNLNIINKKIPKVAFYKQSKFKNKDKKLFVDKIDNINLLYSINEDNIHINKGEYVDEILIFLINLKEYDDNNSIMKISKILDNLMLYKKSIFIYQFGGSYKIVAGYINEIVYKTKIPISYIISEEFSDQSKIKLEISGTNLDQVYENLLGQLPPKELNFNSRMSFTSYISRYSEIKSLQLKISKLRLDMDKEVQFNKKIEIKSELNQAIKKLVYLKSLNK